MEYEREHPLQSFERTLIERSERVQEHLRVAGGAEDHAVLGLQLAPELAMVDDRAREDEVSVFEGHRLVRFGTRVDDTETGVSERDRATDGVRG